MKKNSDLKGKLFRNFGANAYGQIVTIFIQLLSVPLFLYYWGVSLYGEWLILSAVPFYLSLSEMGFATVAANMMTIEFTQGNKKKVLEIYQSTWIFVCSVSFIVALIFYILIFYVPFNNILSINLISGKDASSILLVLTVYVLLGLQQGVLNAAYRTIGKYAFATVFFHSTRLLEWFSVVLVLVFSGSPFTVAIFMVLIRFIALVVAWLHLRLRYAWLRQGVNQAKLKTIRELFKPASAFMAFPLGLAFSMQGMILVVGATLGGASVAIFATYRTLVRVLVQMVTMLNQAFWPEMTSAYGARNTKLVAKLYRKSSFISFWVAFLGGLMLAIFGDQILKVWTHNEIGGYQAMFFLMLLGSFLNVLWQPSWVLLMSINRHLDIAAYFIVFSVLGVVLSWFLMPMFGLNGAALALFIVEIPMLYLVNRKGVEVIGISFSSYIKSIIFNVSR